MKREHTKYLKVNKLSNETRGSKIFDINPISRISSFWIRFAVTRYYPARHVHQLVQTSCPSSTAATKTKNPIRNGRECKNPARRRTIRWAEGWKIKERGQRSRVGQAANRMLDARSAQLSCERLFSLCRCVCQSHLNVEWSRKEISYR